MDKRQDFLWIVQTILLANKDGVLGFAGVVGDAVAASYLLPDNLTARQAALQFCEFTIDSWREQARGVGSPLECPAWMSGLPDPAPSVYETRGLLTV